MIRQTSRDAYYSLNDLGGRQIAVLETIRDLKSACNLDISEHLDVPINSITPRTKELVDGGLVLELERKISDRTGRKVIYWTLSPDGEKVFQRLV